MTPSQKVLYLQLQIAGLGLIIAAFGIFRHVPALLGVGILVFCFGLLRFFFFKKHLEEDDGSSLSQEEIDRLMNPNEDRDDLDDTHKK